MRKYAVNDDREIRRNIDDYDDELKNWTGQWMPHRPNDPTVPPKVFPKVDQTTVLGSSQSPHGVPMGYPSKSCDDAKVRDRRILVDRSNCRIVILVNYPQPKRHVLDQFNHGLGRQSYQLHVLRQENRSRQKSDSDQVLRTHPKVLRR